MEQEITELERKTVELLKALRSQQSDHKKAIAIYNEFKRLRIEIGKPPRTFDSSATIMEDLSGEGFSAIVQDVKRGRGNFKRRSSVY